VVAKMNTSDNNTLQDLKRVKPFIEPPNATSINLLCVFRNESLLLPYFIDYYVKLGVTHFTFIDNDSTDDSMQYVKSRTDINSQIFYVRTSYAANMYGVNWVNKIMNIQFKDMWCVVVDIDELMIPESGKTLHDIRREMEFENANVLVNVMVDFYPCQLGGDEYKRGSSFQSHSCYFDEMSEKTIFYEHQLDNQLTFKGGLRHRLVHGNKIPTNNSVCLTKRNFFKNDFYATHYLAEGMHWLIPIGFVSWMDSKNRELWGTANKHLRFFSKQSVIGHFKYLKPNIKEVFEERVARGEDWSGLKNGEDKKDASSEYKEYVKNFKESFYCEDVSIVMKTIDDVYDKTINKILNLHNDNKL
jgi:hypothetical protein